MSAEFKIDITLVVIVIVIVIAFSLNSNVDDRCVEKHDVNPDPVTFCDD